MLTKLQTLKIEQVLVHYLLKSKLLTLQGIGTFQLDATIPDSMDPDKPIIIPENAITFHYDPKVKEDEGLVDFIVEHTNKIRPLASSDLDSYLSLGIQFLNIGKPLTIPNIGTLEKLNSGELAFKPGELIAQKMEPHKLKRENADEEVEEESLFNDYQQERKSDTGKKVFYALLVLIFIGLIGWAIYHFNSNKSEPAETISSTEAIVPVTDSAAKKDTTTAPVAMDTFKNKTGFVDTFSFKVVVNEYDNLQRAQSRLATLKSYNRKVILYTDDSIIYKIAETSMRPLSDTTKVLDSFRRYYSRAYLDIK